jgi:hypothetical protein
MIRKSPPSSSTYHIDEEHFGSEVKLVLAGLGGRRFALRSFDHNTISEALLLYLWA